jgi:ketosteroid isomerase-like protein
MAESAVEKFRRAIDAFNRGDVDAALDLVDIGIEWFPTPHALGDGALPYYHGHQGIRDLLRDLQTGGVEIELDFERIEPLGDDVIAVGLLRAHDGSGAVSERPLVYRVEVEEGKARCVRAFTDERSALRDAVDER